MPDAPAGALWALSGDAAQRAVTAWHLGWKPARAALPEHFAAPLLAALLDDPYAAVRRVAGRSLAVQPRHRGFVYDFLSSPEERARASARALAGAAALDERDRALYAFLLSRRDETPLRIIE